MSEQKLVQATKNNDDSIPHFKTRARLIYQLGEQLIKSESIALMELVKNAYDADASVCTVQITNPDNKESGAILIEDNGIGMDFEILKHAWLEVGTDNKGDKKKAGYRTPKFNRITLGEKGIGRFGVHRLGKRIELISRMKDKKECVLRIDWDKVNESKYIEDIPIILEEREPKVFLKSSGTKITITKLRNNWTRGTLRDVARSLNTLNSPFDSAESFSVLFETDNDWLDGLLTYDDIKDKKLYEFNLRINKNRITDFTYDFIPYKDLSKVSPHHVSYQEFSSLSRMVKKIKKNEQEEIDISKYHIGEIIIKGILFDLDSKVLSLGLTSGKKELKDYLAVNGGIRVFRDNMRIWDYGEIDNDWLDLDAKRVNQPSFKLSNRLILASVYLDGSTSFDLIEKSNREGFVDNDAYREFKDACSYAIEKVEFYRNQDKEKIRRAYNTKVSNEVPVLDSIEDVKEIVKSKVPDETVREQLIKKLDRIGEDYTRITDNLIKSAGTGLNLIAVLHQIEKIIKNMKSSLRGEESTTNQITENVSQLDKLVEGYSLLARNYKPEIQELNKLVDYALQNDSFRFKAHKISVINRYKEREKKYEGICSVNYLINATMNLFDNSIWWLGYAETINPKIFVDITEDIEGYSTIIVADNGPGFALSKDELGNPFITAKPAGAGMGLGLHLTKEIMNSLHGRLLFPEPDDFSIPDEFKKGAIVALAFKKEK